MKIRWTRFALQDLRHLHEYIAEDNPMAAYRMISRIDEATQHLKTNPEMGRPGRCSGTRELVIAGTPYIVVYTIQGEEIQIVAVIHGAMRWPDTL
jgi:toxin ParE1/3/4